MSIMSFSINVHDVELDDLKDRVAKTRWPAAFTDDVWAYGTNIEYMRTLASYWKDEFDWRKQERALNDLAQVTLELDGLQIHAFHIRSHRPDAIPLLLCHGWPGGNVEFAKILPLLVDPQDPYLPAFHVVAPAMPGYGFSTPFDKPGMGIGWVARLWADVMKRLGYERFGVQGGDWGAWVAIAICRENEERVIGAHLNYVPPRYMPTPGEDGGVITQEERASVDRRALWNEAEWGYGHIQSTKPLTLAYGLGDSPIGLAAWIIEKFHGWADTAKGFESVFTMDELLTNISIYWFTNTIGPSVRLYKESKAELASASLPTRKVATPFAVASFPRELPFWPRSQADKFLNILRWTEMPVGGHFAAMEQPEVLASDIRAFFAITKG